MNSTSQVPVPKTPRKQTSRDDRLKFQYALSNRLTPQKKRRCGRKVLLNTPQRKRLIEWVTSSRTARRTRWADIPTILNFDCGEHAIRTAFKKEGYSDFNGLLSMKIGQKNNGLQSVGVMRLGFSRENIQKIGLLER
ncbi:hypothetical protein PZA11_002219 [Diplocarpon coronariae]